MSAVATAYVWANSKATGSNLLVLLAIADAANQDCEESFQSVATLGRMARVSESTVHRALVSLVAHKEIVHTGDHPKYGTRVYALSPSLKGGVNLAPLPEEGGVTEGPEGVSPVTPEPTTNPTTTTTHTPPVSQDTRRGKMTSSWNVTAEARRQALERFPSINHARERDAFRDWHIGQDTAPKTAAQWDALFLGWCARKQTKHEQDNPATSSRVERDPITGMPVNPKPMNIVSPGETQREDTP